MGKVSIGLSMSLVGEWEVSGDVRGTVSYEWMEGGGFFLLQRVDFGQQYGQEIEGLEVIGHERLVGEAPSEEIKSRFYSSSGDTIDYIYDLEGDTLTIWAGERGSPAYYRGAFSEDRYILTTAWHYPDGGYEAISTRVE